MENLFIEIINISYKASIAILVVMLVRCLFYMVRVPKKFTYLLWFIPLIRMIFPFTVESMFGLIPSGACIMRKTGMEREIYNFSHVESLDSKLENVGTSVAGDASNVLSAAEQNPGSSIFSDIIRIAAFIWVAGLAVLLIYNIYSYIAIRIKLMCSIRVRDNIYLADGIGTSFVFGLVRPKIYLPSGLKDDKASYIISHEQKHIKRKDYIMKPLMYLLTCIYWFNPLSWICFYLFAKDMEMACDEAV